jgi:hypothetical protein
VLELKVHSPLASVSMNQSLPLAVVWTNQSTQRVVLRGEPGPSVSGGLTITITDSDGVSRNLAPRRSRLTTQQVVNGSRRIELLPGHGHGIAARLAASELFPVPGRYRISASYQSPLPTPGNPSATAGAIEGSIATAAAVEIEVLP